MRKWRVSEFRDRGVKCSKHSDGTLFQVLKVPIFRIPQVFKISKKQEFNKNTEIGTIIYPGNREH